MIYSSSDLTPETVDLPEQIPEVERAIIRFKEGNRAAALDELTKAASAHPELPPAKVMLGRMLLYAGKLADARRILEESAVESPGYPGVYSLFGNLALNDGRVADALALFEKVLRLAESTELAEPERQRFRVRGWAGLAAVAEVRRDWPTVRESLVRWLEIEPASAAARQRLAKAEFRLGDPQKALRELEQSVHDDSRLEPPETTLARLYAEQQKNDEAARWFAAGLKRAPDDSRAQLGLAGWLLQQEKFKEAKAPAEAAARLDPRSSQAQLLLGVIARQSDDLETAEKVFGALVEASPADFTAANLLALVLIESPSEKKRFRAMQLAEINARQHPQQAEARATLGWVYLRLQRLAEADEALKGAVSGGAARPDTAYYLARLLAQRGEKSEARRLLRDALTAPLGQFACRRHAQRWWDSEFAGETGENTAGK